MKLTDIIKGSEYDLSLFSEEKIAKLESCIVERAGKRVQFPLSLVSFVRKKSSSPPRRWCDNSTSWCLPRIWAILSLA